MIDLQLSDILEETVLGIKLPEINEILEIGKEKLLKKVKKLQY